MFLSVLLFISTAAFAEDGGRFTFLGESQCAPFEGVLFDPPAVATILVEKTQAQYQCDLEIEYHLDMLSTEFDFERENYNIRYDSLKEEYELIIEQKDIEITQLRESLLKQSPRNNLWWAIGGVVAGSAITYGAYMAFNPDADGVFNVN